MFVEIDNDIFIETQFITGIEIMGVDDNGVENKQPTGWVWLFMTAGGQYLRSRRFDSKEEARTWLKTQPHAVEEE